MKRSVYRPARHHWWPQSVSSRWVSTEGCLHRLSCKGEEKKLKPKAVAAIRNGHYINFGESSWSTSFEEIFDRADSQFPEVLDWLGNLGARPLVQRGFEHRFLAQPITNLRRKQLGECLASLVVRSPYFRHLSTITAEHFQQELGLRTSSNEQLVAANVQRCYRSFATVMGERGKFAVLFTEGQEFIFGDGFLHTFSPAPDLSMGRMCCVVPLLPDMTVVWIRPIEAFRSEPILVSLFMNGDETAFLNDTVQIYSQDYVFFRTVRPKVLDEFVEGKHLQYRYHETPWLGAFVDSFASWGG